MLFGIKMATAFSKRHYMKKDNLNFFIVDDDPFYAAIFRQYLIFEGYRKIQVFDNGKDCLDSLEKQPDVIILDHFMSPVDGLEVLKKVKEKKPSVYIIYVSSGLDAAIISNSLQKGAFCYIVKGENELNNMINELHKIENAVKLLKGNHDTKKQPLSLTYNRHAFSLS